MKTVLLLQIIIVFSPLSKIISQDFDFTESKVTIGGYGEMHYNNEKLDNQDANTQLDFHRFVLFFGYNWNEKWSFKSEVELEHNLVEEGQGALELEQAYVNYHHADYLGIQAGVLLPSVGLINEYHEPPLFFGVERPEYHNRIIPTTWFGNGAAVYGNYSGLDYKFTVLEGLNSDKFNNSTGIRAGREAGFKPKANRLLYNFRLDYLNIPGLKIGSSISYNDAKGDSTNIPVTIFEFHAKYDANNLISVFEFGNISFDEGNIETARGYYFDLGYNISSLIDWTPKLIPFFRYSDTNTASEVISGGSLEEAFHLRQWMIGLSFKPIDQVVFKVDYSHRTRESDDNQTKLFNLGVGYMF